MPVDGFDDHVSLVVVNRLAPCDSSLVPSISPLVAVSFLTLSKAMIECELTNRTSNSTPSRGTSSAMPFLGQDGAGISICRKEWGLD